ncbi:hypothetical protein ETI10_10465 [Macrococcoides goetzii]|nr:replicative helicase loader/inhibitor [Macrococcus goetzii]TDM39858.1 hypothetical protein ETI10_10465 [Macrococcus goetzii]
MNTNEAIDLIEMISNAYPQSAFTKEKAKVWINVLVKGDYEKSKAKLEYHFMNSKFQPVISDFLVVKEINPYEEFEKQLERDKSLVEKEEADPELRKKRDEAKRILQEKLSSLYQRMDGDGND